MIIDPVIQAFEKYNITDKFLRAAILANIEKESGFQPREENLNYSKTANDRIRKIFGARCPADDSKLNEVKKSAECFAEMVYGHETKIGKSMGHTQPGEGWKYRGRGYIQITGKNNYKFFGEKTGLDLVNNPDILLEAQASAEVACAFILSGLKTKTFKNQQEANRAVTQVIGGGGLNLNSGYGAELLSKVNKFSEKYLNV